LPEWRKARDKDRHAYFVGVAGARYVLRKAFRIVEERARKFDIDSLAHQTLIQIYGSADLAFQVNQIAVRLDISAAFASSLEERESALSILMFYMGAKL